MARENLRASAIKSFVSIPMYFYNIIIPNMSSYYNGDYPCDFDITPVVKCPLLDENTPSFRYYEDTNSFYCFSCRAGGDVIRLHTLFTERLDGNAPTYDLAVDFLYKYFILGRELSPINNGKKKIDFKNEPSKVVIFMQYTSNLEDALHMDNSIKLESKQRIWGTIDEMTLLVSLNKVDALDAKQKIQETVKEETVFRR